MTLPVAPRACMGFPDISKRTVIASFNEGTRTRQFLDNLDPDRWQITSFEPHNQLVCFDIESDSGQIHHLSLTLPVTSYR